MPYDQAFSLIQVTYVHIDFAFASRYHFFLALRIFFLLSLSLFFFYSIRCCDTVFYPAKLLLIHNFVQIYILSLGFWIFLPPSKTSNTFLKSCTYISFSLTDSPS